jgi:hypothetical protein
MDDPAAPDPEPSIKGDEGAEPDLSEDEGDGFAFPEEDLLPHEADLASALLALVPDDANDVAAFCEWYARDGWGEPTMTPNPVTVARLRLAQTLVRLALEPLRSGREDLWIKVDQAVRVFEDERVGVMAMRARVVQILEARCDAYRLLRAKARLDGGDDIITETRELAETIRDLTMVHWRFNNLEPENLPDLFLSDREAIGIAAALSILVGAFGDDDLVRARNVYRKAAGLYAGRPPEARPKLGRRARRSGAV